MIKNYIQNFKNLYYFNKNILSLQQNKTYSKKFQFCTTNPNPLQTINYDDPEVQKLVEAIESGDKKILQKILKGLDQALDYQDMIENKDFDRYARVLTESEVYKVIQTVVKLPEDVLIQKIKDQEDGVEQFFVQQVRHRIKKIPNEQSIRILKAMYQNDKEEYNAIWKVWKNEFQRRLEHMSIDDISNLVNIYAHSNKYTKEFFRDIENELMERDWEFVPVHCVSKLLKGFSYSNLGSSMVYNKIAKTIKVAQHEIDPLKLADYAYMYSKASENMKAGFGVYHVAEAKITQYLYRYNINELARLSKSFMGQKIGSYQLHEKLEEEIYNKYPLKIETSTLVKFIKNTSKYYFHYKDRALYNKLESDCIKQLEDMVYFIIFKDGEVEADILQQYQSILQNQTIEQISEVVWSYGRGRTGSYPLWQLLEEVVIKKLKHFSNRQLAFIYHSFSISGRGSNPFFDDIESEILERGLDQFSSHLTVKLIHGLNIRNAFDSKLFAPIIVQLDTIDENSNQYKYSEIIQFLYMLVQTPPLYLEKLQYSNDQYILFQKYDKLFKKFQPMMEESLSIQRIDQLCQLFIAYGQSNTGTQEFYQQILNQIPSAYDVPKNVFSQFIFTLCQHLQLDFAQQFLPIIQDLRDYGNIKYFFSHDDFIRVTWSSGLLSQFITEEDQQGYKTRNKFDIQFWENVYSALMEINPNTLKFHTVPIYIQNLMLMLVKMKQSDKFAKKGKEFGAIMENTFKKINQLTPAYKQEISQRDLSNLTDKDLKNDVFNKLYDRVEEQFTDKKVKFQLIQNFVDELMNTIDVALFIQDGDHLQKIAVVILNENHYKLKDSKNANQDNLEEHLLLSIQSKFSLMQDILEWNLIMVEENQWKNMSDDQQTQFFYDQIQLEDTEQLQQQQEQKIKQQQQRKQQRSSKKQSFREKKQRLNQQKAQNDENEN